MNCKKHSLHGKIFVLSAPSGAGKTTLVKIIKKTFPFLIESVSCTTRKPRNSEKDKVDYFFLEQEEFIRQKEAGLFAEWAKVHGNYYGTPLKYLEDTIKTGNHIICDIDYQGALKIRERFPEESVLIFVLPPSMEELEKRLRKRATDDDEIVRKRLENAKKEIGFYKNYDFIVVNNSVNEAVELMSCIIKANVEATALYNYEVIKSFN